jgi:hypothetical protein
VCGPLRQGQPHLDARMVNLSREEREDALFKLMYLCWLRGKGGSSEDEIAEQLGFSPEMGLTSAEVMREQLRVWGLPDWVVYAEPPKAHDDQKARREPAATQEEGKKRKVQSSGEMVELPLTVEAEPLFSRDLDLLERYLTELPFLIEFHERGLFTSMLVVRDDAVGSLKEDLEHFRKRTEEGSTTETILSEEESSKRTEQYEKFRKWYREFMGWEPYPDTYPPLTSVLYTHGSKRTPWEGLERLIGVHMLLDGSIDTLIDALHPSPHEVDREKVYRDLFKEKHGYVTMLKTSAKQIAITVRGGKVRVGRQDEEDSPEEMWGALNLIGTATEMGYSDEEIYWELKEHFLDEEDRFWGVKYTPKEIKRLRNRYIFKDEPSDQT